MSGWLFKIIFKTEMYLCLLLFRFMSFLSTALFGRFIGIYGSCFISCFSLFLSFLLSLLAVYEVIFCDSVCNVVAFSWFDYELFVSP